MGDKVRQYNFIERTKHYALLTFLQSINRLADNHEMLSWTTLTFVESELKSKIADASSQLTGINTAHSKAKKDMTNQLGRVKHAKKEYNSRVADLEKVEATYEKYQEDNPPETRDIKEEDKLRVQVADKKALVTRAQEEHDRQVATYNELQDGYYKEDLPSLCRSQKEVHLYLTDIWKHTLEEFVQKNKKKISDNQEEMVKLEETAGRIDKDVDANIIYKNFPSETVMPAPLNTILDLEQFQFPVAPTVAAAPLSPNGKTRRLSEAVCLLTEAEKEERM